MSDNQVIPDAAVEDAALVTYEVGRRLLGYALSYEESSEDTKRIYRTIARAALEAAAPYMGAPVLSEGGYCCTPDSGDCCGPGSWCCARAGKHDHDEAEESNESE